MEKGSFWDRLLGTKRARATEDGSLQEIIAERRMKHSITERKEEEKRTEEQRARAKAHAEWRALPAEKRHPYFVGQLETILHNLDKKILETADRGFSMVYFDFGDSMRTASLEELEEFQAFKKIQAFCNKNRFELEYSPGSYAEYYDSDIVIRAQPACIRITF